MSEHKGFPPGHFYSPIVNTTDVHAVRAVRDRLVARLPAGVDLDGPRMLQMMRKLACHHRHFVFPRHLEEPYRFYFDNPFFGPHDASVLFSMLLASKPKRVIEVGCGYSSCLLLDTNEMFFNSGIDLTLIDPSLEDLSPLFGSKGTGRTRSYGTKIQDVPIGIFEELEADDILFVDTSHVSKTGSDVNHVFFQILPRLKPGVLIHIHDIFYPFEYPETWVLEEQRGWNEAYILCAFLQYNSAFEIAYWTNFVWHQMPGELHALMPLCMENEGGSIWLRRVL